MVQARLQRQGQADVCGPAKEVRRVAPERSRGIRLERIQRLNTVSLVAAPRSRVRAVWVIGRRGGVGEINMAYVLALWCIVATVLPKTATIAPPPIAASRNRRRFRERVGCTLEFLL